MRRRGGDQPADAGGDGALLVDEDEGEEEGEEGVVDELAGALEQAVDDGEGGVDVAAQEPLELVAEDGAGVDPVGRGLLHGARLGGGGGGGERGGVGAGVSKQSSEEGLEAAGGVCADEGVDGARELDVGVVGEEDLLEVPPRADDLRHGEDRAEG